MKKSLTKKPPEKTKTKNPNKAILIDETLLRDWSLPAPKEGDDKNTRGRVVIIGGSLEAPGGILLSAVAALRAGAGKIQIITLRDLAIPLGLALPEAQVIGVDQDKDGNLKPDLKQVLAYTDKADAVLIGPATQPSAALASLVEKIASSGSCSLVLDAGALTSLKPKTKIPRTILTPHAGELAALIGMPMKEITANPQKAAEEAAKSFDTVMVLKGPDTYISDENGKTFKNLRGNSGLAISGSGDSLAGIIAGLLARGADRPHAAVWGVFLHAVAAERLAQRIGGMGFLAREIASEVPALLEELS